MRISSGGLRLSHSAGPATLARECGTGNVEDLAGASQAVSGLARHFCEAGADIVIVFERAAPSDAQVWRGCLQTLSNIVKFHQGLSFLMGYEGPLPAPTVVPLDERRVGLKGLIVTPEKVPPTTSIEALRAWVGSFR